MTEHEIDKASSFGAVRARLIALAYRMLGSRAEAEDIVQDVWLKWHLADTREVQTPAAWLTTLTTRTAIDRLRNVQRERESQATGWLPEPWLDEVAPSAEELALRAAEMSYGVMLLLERLKPDERAAFVLHEAFDCDYAEIGKILQRTPASCRQIVHRARVRLQRAGAPLQRPDAQAHARIVERLRSALEAQDRASLLDLFSDTPEVVSDEPVFGPLNVVARSPAPSVARVDAEAVTNPPGLPAQALAQAPACKQESTLGSTFGDWIEKVTSLAGQASHVELVSVGGAPSIAFLIEGEVVALIDVSTEGSHNGRTSGERHGQMHGQMHGPVCSATSGAQKIVSLRAVTSAARLQAANRVLGRAVVTELLARITRNPVQSIAMGRDFPVDVYA
ncbi:sigma-70 family RNA polymerase sigma factor [Paraburkholderia kirstenboschensis]|uniref:Sigma-70 family RNA polymerase sigma factor n=1 Tax=Paraburkholderia kirstenboschensis TaxID=1245436 RepID=A0ABZ0EVI1_9BURK|nr:sigma-70 family RNA polymerase sigma factor [Paraburkholderia kirstenboschensis]WOD20691.1 sigma-70 family RNA polymerase sigma factor [Paraburkholderia kirstenboschensis]